jgi:SpoVK/Ycf46/Vps4 family AAA+-type ATPase
VLSGSAVELPKEAEHHAVRYALSLPGPAELRDVLRTVLDSLRKTSQVRVTLDPDELETLIQTLAGMTVNQARQAIAWAALKSGQLGPEEIAFIRERKLAALRESGPLEYFPVEDNRFSLAGFANLKQWLERAQLGFSPEARALNLDPPKGILLVGVQGCGKSLAAKVIARSWSLPLLKLDAGSLYDKYIGESEKNLRRATAQAEAMAPVVLWIDEIEKGLSSDGGDGDGGVSRRMLGSFLTWLQEKRADVFVVATANDVFSLPPELLRKGRFDELFFVDLPQPEERARILEIHLELRRQDPKDFDLPALVAATDGFSGAELEQAVIASLYRALHAKQPLTTELLLEELAETVPLSVSRREDVERLREVARDRFVPVA